MSYQSKARKMVKIGDEVIINNNGNITIGKVRDTYNHGMAVKLVGIENRSFDIADCIIVDNDNTQELIR